MPWRYFYSTDESDAALKAILAGQDITSGGALVAGVYEYRVLLDSDIDFVKLANDVRIAQIRAIASPERTTQFGTILPTNYFDSSSFAVGTNARDTDTLYNMISWLNAYCIVGDTFAQRDIEIQGTASLGTVKLTLTNNYTKTYNTPINGTISDNNMVKVIRDSVTMALTQTNATGNSAMFDFVKKPTRILATNIYVVGTWNTSPSLADTRKYAEDYLIELWPATDYMLNTVPAADADVVFDYGSVANRHFATALNGTFAAGCSARILTSSDGVTWNSENATSANNTCWCVSGSKSFRYLKVQGHAPGGGASAAVIKILEIVVW